MKKQAKNKEVKTPLKEQIVNNPKSGATSKSISKTKALIAETPDEDNFKNNYNASFHKLLEHDVATGLLTAAGRQSYEKLKEGLLLDQPDGGFDQNKLNLVNLAVPKEIPPAMPTRRLLVNPQSSKSLTVNGEKTSDVKAYKVITRYYKDVNDFNNDPHIYYGSAAYSNEKAMLNDLSFLSGVTAAEMLELYIMALLRDVPFGNYQDSQASVKQAVDALNEFDAGSTEGDKFKGPKENVAASGASDYKVTVRTLLRGSSPGDLKGDYLSKYFELLRPPLFPSGCGPGVANLINATLFYKRFGRLLDIPEPNSNSEWCLTWDHYVRIQNGEIPKGYVTTDFTNRRVPISNGRHLATLVHTDGFYEEFLWAADVLTAGNYPRSLATKYSQPSEAYNEGDGPTLGIPNAASLVGAVALDAGRAAWRQKWVVARRARPEVMGGLIHQLRAGGDTATYGNINPKLLKTFGKISDVLEAVKTRNIRLGGSSAATYLLPQIFPEASPAHPAWTSGHATIAGACATVIKAIFDDRAKLKDNDGNPYPDGQGGNLLVGEELDKLASNVAFGRNFGGVHFRSDGEHGIFIGEEIAIKFLQKHLETYKEKFRGNDKPFFELTKRSGKRIKITANNVTNVSEAAKSVKTKSKTAFSIGINENNPGAGTIVM